MEWERGLNGMTTTHLSDGWNEKCLQEKIKCQKVLTGTFNTYFFSAQGAGWTPPSPPPVPFRDMSPKTIFVFTPSLNMLVEYEGLCCRIKAEVLHQKRCSICPNLVTFIAFHRGGEGR